METYLINEQTSHTSFGFEFQAPQLQMAYLNRQDPLYHLGLEQILQVLLVYLVSKVQLYHNNSSKHVQWYKASEKEDLPVLSSTERFYSTHIQNDQLQLLHPLFD